MAIQDDTQIARIRNFRMADASATAPNPFSKLCADLKQHASGYYFENQTANESRRIADRFRRKLLGLMKSAGVAAFELSTSRGPATVVLDVAIETPETSKINASKLYELMEAGESPENLAKFLATVSGTQKSVTEVLGTAAVAACSEPYSGTENVSVMIRKD